MIELIERAVNNRERFAVAMPRGQGKTTLCEVAVIWAVLTGRHQFVYLIGATEPLAVQLMNNIKAAITTNPMLGEDFPEAVFPFVALQGEARKAGGQRYYGERTHIRWDDDKVVFASVPGARCSGAIIKCTSLHSAIRGAKVTRPSDGKDVRPTLALIDDPQTDKSAVSPPQVRERLKIINGAISGLPGPEDEIGILVPCTVIAPDDVADQLLNREKHPEWQGIRTKLVLSFPHNETLWAEYRRIRDDSFRNGGNGEQAARFYKRNRKEMDAGSECSWPARHPGCISAIEFAMVLRFKDEATFFSEYQNEPLSERLGEQDTLSADEIAKKVNGLARWILPNETVAVTAFIDVQLKCLYWVIVAWAADHTGSIIAYGAYPDQKTNYFHMSNAKRTIRMTHPKGGIEAALQAALTQLCQDLLDREYETEDGAVMRINRCLIDSGWGEHSELVYKHCRRSPFAAVLMPSKGRAITASSRPISEWESKPGQRRGPEWITHTAPNVQRVRLLHFDANYYKTFAHARLSTEIGDAGSVTLHGDTKSRDAHVMFGEHCTAEYRVRTKGRGRSVDEWKLPVSKPDNHFLDCLAGCCVAASYEGIVLGARRLKKPKRRKRARPAGASVLNI